jgi:hypothetical protein
VDKINKDRINFIRACKNEFGNKFIGGIVKDKFSEKAAPDLIIPFTQTKKNVFLENIKRSNICVATSGLNNSTGWKLGEYVAASRAIVSEPLHYELPGSFSAGTNYLSFSNQDELIKTIYKLMDNKELLRRMMKSNYDYYQNFVRSDMLILNSLLTIDRIIKKNNG